MPPRITLTVMACRNHLKNWPIISALFMAWERRQLLGIFWMKTRTRLGLMVRPISVSIMAMPSVRQLFAAWAFVVFRPL